MWANAVSFFGNGKVRVTEDRLNQVLLRSELKEIKKATLTGWLDIFRSGNLISLSVRQRR